MIDVSHRLKRRWIALPFTDSCAPLARDVTAGHLAAQLSELRQSESLASLEVRASLPGPGHPSPNGHRHVIELDADADAVFRRLNNMRGRWVKRSAREHVEVRRGESARDLHDGFYRLHVKTRRRLGVPVQSWRFFELMWERLLEPELGFVLTAYHRSAAVASSVFLSWNGRLVYKFGASDRDQARVGGGDAAMWAAVRWGCEHGFTSLDLGRTEAGNEGLRAYKQSWGSKEEELLYTLLADAPPRPGSGRATRIVGAVIRHSPALVGRAIGWAAYRYAA